LADEPTTDPTDDAPPAPNPKHDWMIGRLREELGAELLDTAVVFDDLVVRVRTESWRRVAEVAHEQLDCDYLCFISAIDWQPAAREGDDAGGDASSPVQPTEISYGAAGSEGRFQVFAHVQSTSGHHGLTVKADVGDDAFRVASWVPVYPGADWHERECWEMFGIVFDGHPALRHLYLPNDFEGHPLRKDFPLLARVVKPWPGLVDVEAMPAVDTPEPAAVPAADEDAS
jgi:NADH-quinone oxidoreductase subunit C